MEKYRFIWYSHDSRAVPSKVFPSNGFGVSALNLLGYGAACYTALVM